MGNKEIMDDEGISEILKEEFEPKKWEGLLTYVFSRGKEGKDSKAHFDVSPDDVTVSNQLAKGAHRLGWITLAESKQIAVYKVELLGDVDIVRKRRGIRDMLNSDWHKGYEGAFIVSYPKGNKSIWRFSFVGKKDGGEETTATYLLGKGQECRTAAERFKKLHNSKQGLADVVEAFSVEALTKEFYKEIEDWFKWAKDKVEFPGHKYLEISKEEHQAKMTLRLITRLIFIWFLKEKGLVPEKLFNKDDIYPLLKREKPSPYYRAILQNLFFATLNTPIEKREWLKGYECRGMNPKRGDQEYFRYWDFFKGERERETFFKGEKGFCGKIPFVNGGLFENLDGPDPDDDNQRVDCFSERNSNLKPERLKVPDELFFGEKDEGEEERKGKKKGKKKKERKGIIDILKRYNFTLEENTPDDEEVALDPELLGCVFENLLAFVNPETSKPARNASGSFYTPREIVDYMVSESLKAYLSTKVGDGECLEALFATKPSEEAKYKDNGKFKDAVAKALDEVKILDPACGSGAFPMGMLSKMIQILEKIGKIDPSNPRQIYKKKLQIIQDCIYGVDIQDIAVQISKLRFFISLLCDQVKDDKKDNYGIEALPNLETKIVCADTLKKLPKSEYDALLEEDKEINELKDKLFEKRKEYFNEKEKVEKRKLRRIDKAKREELEKIIKEFVENNTIGLISKKKSKLAQCEKELEKVKDPRYEEIAAVPVQQELEQIVGPSAPKKLKQQQLKVDLNEPVRKSLEKEILKLTGEISELEKAISGEGGKGEGQDDAPPIIKAAKLIAGWDPYNPSKREKFFSPEWMFGISEGFDIVIGNPPYIRLEKDTKTQYEKEEYKTAGDIYCLFYERGWQLLKNGGHLCFITSNKWMRNDYGKETREFFTTKTNPKLLIDFPGVKIFKSATVDTNILLLSKSNYEHETRCAVATRRDASLAKNLDAFMEKKGEIYDFSKFGGGIWVVLSDVEEKIKKHIEKKGTPLKDWGINIYRGILTGCNDAFHISEAKRNEILANCKSEKEQKRTNELLQRVLIGEDIKRHGYNFADRWLIATFPSRHYDIDQYPALKRYLISFGPKRLEQTGETHIIDGKKIKARKKTNNKWFELQDSTGYWRDFYKPKVVYPETTQGAYFVYDEDSILIDKTCFMLISSDTTELKYLQATLRSRLFEFAYKRIYSSVSLGEKGYQYNKHALLKLPVAKKYEPQSAYSDSYFYKLYNLLPDEIDFIESQYRTEPEEQQDETETEEGGLQEV